MKIYCKNWENFLENFYEQFKKTLRKIQENIEKILFGNIPDNLRKTLTKFYEPADAVTIMLGQNKCWTKERGIGCTYAKYSNTRTED